MFKTYKYNDISVGTKETFKRQVTKDDVLQFSRLTGDINPLHLDKEYAKETRFKKPVVYGLLINSFLSRLAGMYLPGKYSLILSIESNLKNPCFENDVLIISGTVKTKIDTMNIIVINTLIENQNNQVILTGNMRIQVLR